MKLNGSFPMSWRVMVDNEPLLFETESIGSATFVSRSVSEQLEISVQWTLSDDTVSWSARIRSASNGSLSMESGFRDTHAIVASLRSAVGYCIEESTTGTLHVQQFVMLSSGATRLHVDIGAGETVLFGICYSAGFMQQAATLNSVLRHFLDRAQHPAWVVAAGGPIDTTSEMQSAIDEVIHTHLQGFHLQCLLKARAIDVLNHALRQVERHTVPDRKMYRSDLDNLRQLHTWILNHLDYKHTLISLSRRAGMNISKMQHLFRETYGTSVIAFIRHKRLQRARRQLKETSINQKTIAAQAGYRSLSAFTQAFSAVFQATPSSVRRSVQPKGGHRDRPTKSNAEFSNHHSETKENHVPAER